MAPALLGIVIFFVYPLFSALYFSFTKFNLLSPPRWVGLENYRFMAEDQNLLAAAKNTAWFVVVLVPARILASLGTGVLLSHIKRGASVYRTIFYLPALVPPVAATIAFVYLFKPETGPVNTFLAKVGIEGPLWFNSPTWSKPSLVLLGIWSCGDLMVIFLAALLDVPVEQHEAAQLDGANAWQRFRNVTLPGLRSVSSTVILLGVIWTFNQFAIIFLLFGSGAPDAQILVTWAYRLGFGQQPRDYAQSAAYGVLLLSILIVFTAFYRRWLARNEQLAG
jgi:multiple sugar transport system permease protein